MSDIIENSFQPRTKQRRIKKSTKKPKKIRGPNEDTVQILFMKWIRENHPDLLMSADASGIKLTIGQAMKMKRSGTVNRGWPDTSIFEPNDTYHGLLIELKRDGEKIYKVKSPNEFASPHLVEQAITMKRLNAKGYCATFAVGLEEAIKIVKSYLSNEEIPDKYNLEIKHRKDQ